MAVGNFTVNSNALLSMTQGALALNAGTFVMVLLTSSYTPSPDTHATWSQVSTNEVANGNGYTTGGVVLSSVTCTLSGSTITFTTGAGSWPSSTITAKYAYIVKRAGASLTGTDQLICYSDLNTSGGSVSDVSGTFSVTPSGSGVFTLTHTP